MHLSNVVYNTVMDKQPLNLNQNHKYLLSICNGNVEYPDSSKRGRIIAYDLSVNASDDDIYAAEYRIRWHDKTESYFGYQVLNGQIFVWSRPARGFIHIRRDRPPTHYNPDSGEIHEVQLTPA